VLDTKSTKYLEMAQGHISLSVRSEINLIGDMLDIWLVETNGLRLDITLLCASMLLLIGLALR
jgi:hypothetical protein